MRRGAVYNHPRFPERRFAVVSAPEVANLGTVILADIDSVAPEGTSGLLAVTLTDHDPVSGAVMVHLSATSRWAASATASGTSRRRRWTGSTTPSVQRSRSATDEAPTRRPLPGPREGTGQQSFPGTFRR